MGDEIKLIVQEKNVAYKKYHQTQTIDNEMEYKRRRATAKREIRKRYCYTGNDVHHTYDLTYTKQNQTHLNYKNTWIKTLKNQQISTLVQVKKHFYCYKELWTNNSLQEND